MANYRRYRKLRVLIADDSAQIRLRLAAMLDSIDGVEVVGDAESMQGALAAITELKPDLVILDLHLPDGSGFNVLEQVQAERPGLKVIVLTNYPLPAYRDRCGDLGTEHFFDKSTEFAQAVELVRQLAVGLDRQE
jgi:DNA-binding NarL/FixJ family response regulator